MQRSSLRWGVRLFCLAALILLWNQRCRADEVIEQQVTKAIGEGRRFLLKAQEPDGSWSRTLSQHSVGGTSLALLALLNTGMTAADPEIARGLDWLRAQKPGMTYDMSLMIQTLAAAGAGDEDKPRIAALVQRLEESQLTGGAHGGSWTYNNASRRGVTGDRSNGQFAVLALTEARLADIPVSSATWRRARDHWLASQNPDGGWDYKGSGKSARSTGSMTVAGISTLVITEAMLKGDENEVDRDGLPNCCSEHGIDQPLERACRWLGNNFAVASNPGSGLWPMYYLYGLERAGRFSGRRFFINGRGQKHDWYREGTEFLVRRQNRTDGSWRGAAGDNTGESNPVVATSFALMFLSKGLAPVLINKLEYGTRDAASKRVILGDWNRHKDDVRNLTLLASRLPGYPRLLTWQTVDSSQATLPDLMQAPILFLSGSQAPQLTPPEIAELKDYILHGGFIFADSNCQSAQFDEGFRELVRRMYQPPEARLVRLTAEHPVFRSEFNLLDASTGQPTAELWGVDVGCRTSIIYSPNDLSCLWDKWTPFDVPTRSNDLVSKIDKATRVGINVVAYVTGKKILNKMERQAPVSDENEKIERHLLQISKIRYAGDWDAAPGALKNLLVALNATAGMQVSTEPRHLALLDPNLFRYPVMYMHGRHEFALGKGEQDKLRDYVRQGGVLFSDACCGSPAFDRSFRRLMEQVFPETPLKPIPAGHDLFTKKVGHDISTVKLREPAGDNADGAPPASIPPVSGRPVSIHPVSIREVQPFLEGIEVNGRFVVVYSKHDISCALEGEPSAACTGYVHEDAVRIGVNVIVYALLQ